MKTALAAAVLLLCVTAARPAEKMTVLTPPCGEKAYQIAGEAFVNTWREVTGERLALQVWNDSSNAKQLPEGNLVLIGSDAVHPLVHRMILDGAIDSLGIRYGEDGYRMVCLPYRGRRVLILAGGSGRSTIYAVYDLFRRQAGKEYFWDGDVIPKRSHIDFDKVDVTE